ncbi:MAG: septal ring lytic transglycosylase RlpA family protein [Candidatus Solibacter usitatus]|nr:septal ring lytic transglycosylase RlpA family protein [Candidatus Solibacter usitatus]
MTKRLIVSHLALAVIWISGGCAKRRPVAVAVPLPPGGQETGVASWYGHPYHGRQAASGEIYDMDQLTAAHRTLPFGTWVRVENLDNGKSVEVRINDRGPFVEGRIIDLSRAAAEAIGMVGPGTAKVRLEVIPPKALEAARFAVQVGVFSDLDNAERMRTQMERRYGSARLLPRPGDPARWRVLVGALPAQESAEALAAVIRKEEAKDAFVVRLDEP